MNFTAVNLTPRTGTEIKSDPETLLGGSRAEEIRRLLAERISLDKNDRMMHRTTLAGEEALA